MSDLGLRATLNLLLSPKRHSPALPPPSPQTHTHTQKPFMYWLLPKLLFFYWALNLFFAFPLLLPLHPAPILLFFSPPIFHSNLQYPESFFHTTYLSSLHLSLSSFFSATFTLWPVWPFIVSLSFSFLLTPPILCLSFRLKLMPSVVCSIPTAGFPQTDTSSHTHITKRRCYFMHLQMKSTFF